MTTFCPKRRKTEAYVVNEEGKELLSPSTRSFRDSAWNVTLSGKLKATDDSSRSSSIQKKWPSLSSKRLAAAAKIVCKGCQLPFAPSAKYVLGLCSKDFAENCQIGKKGKVPDQGYGFQRQRSDLHFSILRGVPWWLWQYRQSIGSCIKAHILFNEKATVVIFGILLIGKENPGDWSARRKVIELYRSRQIFTRNVHHLRQHCPYYRDIEVL